MKRSAAAAVLVVCCALCPVRAEERGPFAEGSLAWTSSDDLDLVGAMAVEFPFATVGPWRIFGSARAVTAIEKATSNFTFLVDRVSYSAYAGARRPLRRLGVVELFAGEQGFDVVDAGGRGRVRVVGAAWESANFHRGFGPPGWSGRAALAAVVEDRGVSASATASGAVRFMGIISHSGRIGFGADASCDALIGNDSGADVAIGPRVEFDLGQDRRFGLFLRWLDAGNPLGIGADGVMAGFDFAEGVHHEGARPVPPEIAGLAAAGAGSDGRSLARLDFRVASPPFLSGTYAMIEVDGNVLTADDLNDLFYLYDVGVVHPVASFGAGVWFHHRSNHVINDVNPTVTSIDVLEAGVESSGWNRDEPGISIGRAGDIDVQLRAGWLIDSSFGKDSWWHARGGVRWASPSLGPTRITVSAALERGDVSGSRYAAGLLLPRGWNVEVEFRHDEQLFSAYQRARLLTASLRY